MKTIWNLLPAFCVVSLVGLSCAMNPKVAETVPITGADLSKNPTAEGPEIVGDGNTVFNFTNAGYGGVSGMVAMLWLSRRRHARALNRTMTALENHSSTGAAKKFVKQQNDRLINRIAQKRFGGTK